MIHSDSNLLAKLARGNMIMNPSLKELENAELVSVTFIHDYLQIKFSSGTGVTINNKFEWSTNDYTSVIGSKVKAVREENDAITFEFSNRERLRIGFKKDDFSGPEGMLLHQEGALTPIILDESYRAS